MKRADETRLVRVLRAADRKVVPWKNGLGVTTQIFASPADGTLDAFDWRVSMARVSADGPFSVFPQIDRQLLVLEGRMTLSVLGREAVHLAPGSPPFAFPGDVPATATLTEGMVTDLNVMTRRSRFTQRLIRAAMGRHVSYPLRAGVTLVLSRSANLIVSLQGWSQTLQMDDGVILQGVPDESLHLEARDSADVCLIELRAVAGGS
jgi:environmental stress-induced protein Ves